MTLSDLTFESNDFLKIADCHKINLMINNNHHVYLGSQNQLIKLSKDSKKIEIINLKQSLESLTLLSQGYLVLTKEKQAEACQYYFHYFSENIPFKKVEPSLQLESKDLKFSGNVSICVP